MSDFGRVLAVSQADLGSTLAVDHVAGATVVSVEDVADFDDTHGGQVSIDGTVYAYGGVDDEADTITLTTGLVADAGAGTGVVLVDPLSGAVQTEWLAQVTVEGSEPGDPLEASIRDALVDRLGPGLRGIAGEPALLEWDSDDELWLIDVLGKPADGRQGTVKFRNTDTFAAAAGADLVPDLTYQPIDGSEHVYWRGVAQVPGVDWTRSGKTLTLLDPGFKTDDPVWVEYAYDITDQPVPPPPPEAAAPSVVGTTAGDARDLGDGVATIASVPLPAGTQEGDLLILAMAAATSVGCTDARFDDGFVVGTNGIWRGIADDTGAAIPVTCTGEGARPEAVAVLLVVRGYPLDSTAEVTGSVAGAVNCTPPMPAAGSFGIAAIIGRSGLTDNGITDDSLGNWTTQAEGAQRLAAALIATADGTPAGQWANIAGGGDFVWRVFGIQ